MGSSEKTIVRDIMSMARTNNYVKHVQTRGFPKNTHIVQEMLQSCNLKPAITNLTPGLKPLSNVSSKNEMFEVHWKAEKNG